jgi:general secretion pathway protein C
METYLQRYGWVGTLLLLGLGSLLTAMILNGYLASKLAPYTVPVLPQVSANKGDKKVVKTEVADRVGGIAKRCLFGCVEKAPEPPTCDPACGADERCDAGVCVSTKVEPGVASDLPVPSDLPLKLVGVMVSNRVEWSTAILQDNATRQSYIVRIGDMVPGEAKLIEVHRQYIVFERNGRKEYIKLDGSLMGAPSTVSTTQTLNSTRPVTNPVPVVAPPTAPAPAVVEAPAVSGLIIDRGTLDQKLKDKNALATGVSVAPNFKNGKTNGIKLISVQPDSVYTKLGLQSGDVLQAINGEQIKNQQHAMELMEKFRGSDSVSIELERRGRKEKLDYKIK